MSQAGARALIVEDDRVWQDILWEILSEAGLGVDVVDHLDAAVSSLRRSSYVLTIADLALDESDHHNRQGLGVLDAVRRYNVGCATILLTGYATVELAVGALTEHGALTCLRKEMFNRRQFRELVQRALAPANVMVNQAAAEPRSDPGFEALTERERQVLELLSTGMTNKEIAQRLVITPNTVKRHLKAIFEKLGIHTRSAAVAKASTLKSSDR